MSDAQIHNDQDAVGGQKKYQDASRTFTEALRRIMRAVDESEDGERKSLTQKKLSDASGVSPGSIKKYMAGNKLANPSLDAICKLAHTFGVPPAFLLMTAEDWTRLSHAIRYYSEIFQNRKFVEFAEKVTRPQNKSNHQDIADAGLTLGQMMGLIQRPNADFDSVEAAAQRTATAATCLAPPITSLDLDFRPLLLTLCTIIGASGSTDAINFA